MSSAEAGPARVTLSRRSLVRGLAAAARRCSGADGLRQRRLPAALRHDRLGRGPAGAPGAGRRCANPGPRRPAHPQRADLPGQRSAAKRLPPTHRLEVALNESMTSTLVQGRWRRARPDLRHRGHLQADRHQEQEGRAAGHEPRPRRLRALPVDLFQRARARGRREPRGARPSPTTSRPGLRPTCRARPERRALHHSSRSASAASGLGDTPGVVMGVACAAANSRMTSDGRRQDAPGRRVPERARSRRRHRRCCSTAPTQGWWPSGPRNWPSASPSAMTRRARSCAWTMPSLEDDPDRIFVELQTAPMFGGRKIVRAAAGRRVTAAQLKPLVEGGDLQGFLIVEAGNLRPDDALRALFEKSPAAAAVACFPDEARDLEGVIREVLAAAKLQITPEARRLLMARLGADRGAVARRDREARALRARQERDRGERRRGRRRRCGRAGARPDRDGGRLGPHGRSARANATAASPPARAPQAVIAAAAAPLPAPAPHARRARCRPDRWRRCCASCGRRRTSSSATRSSSSAAAGAWPSSTRRWRASPRPPRRARLNSAPRGRAGRAAAAGPGRAGERNSSGRAEGVSDGATRSSSLGRSWLDRTCADQARLSSAPTQRREPSMQEHDVVGIGNAIVDIIGRCDDAFLTRHGCTKGSMQLVDAAAVAQALRRHGAGRRDLRRLGRQHHGRHRLVRRPGRLHRQDRAATSSARCSATTSAPPA